MDAQTTRPWIVGCFRADLQPVEFHIRGTSERRLEEWETALTKPIQRTQVAAQPPQAESWLTHLPHPDALRQAEADVVGDVGREALDLDLDR